MDRKLLHDCIDLKINNALKKFHIPTNLRYIFFSAINTAFGNTLESPEFKAHTSRAIIEVLRKQQEQLDKDHEIAVEICQKYQFELQSVSEKFSTLNS